MKVEFLIFAVLAMVISSFLNADINSQPNDQLSVAKLRIENAGQSYAKAQQIKTASVDKKITKPNES